MVQGRNLTVAKPIALTIHVMPKAHETLHRAAKARGYSAAGYAQMLFEAGFAARLRQERDMPADDAELDQQVTLALACAGTADAAAISKATGIPETVVERILAGLKKKVRRS